MKKHLALIVALCLLLAASLACGPLGGDSGPGAEATDAVEATEAPQPTDAAPEDEPEPAPTEETEAPAAEDTEEDMAGDVDVDEALQGVEALDSYVFLITISAAETPDAIGEEVLTMEVAYTSEPEAQRIVMSGADLTAELGGGSIEVVQVGGQSYLVAGGQCISAGAGEDASFMDETLNPSDLLEETPNLRRAGPKEDINGIPSRHFSFSGDAAEAGYFTEYEGEIWIAVDGGYVTKLAVEGQGSNPLTDEEAYMTMEYEVLKANEPVDIGVPEGCADLGGETPGGEWPVLPDAEEVTQLGGNLMYESTSSMDDVVAFYRDEMPAAGWQETDQSVVNEAASVLYFANEGRTVAVTISNDDGIRSVFIMEQ
jgi:hypothetical protein